MIIMAIAPADCVASIGYQFKIWAIAEYPIQTGVETDIFKKHSIYADKRAQKIFYPTPIFFTTRKKIFDKVAPITNKALSLQKISNI